MTFNIAPNSVVTLNSDNLNPWDVTLNIKNITILNVKHSNLPLKLIFNAAIIFFQDKQGRTKILKNKWGRSGTLLDEGFLIETGWIANQTKQQYENDSHQDFCIKLSNVFPLVNPITSEQISMIQTLDIFRKDNSSKVLEKISTLEELLYFFDEKKDDYFPIINKETALLN